MGGQPRPGLLQGWPATTWPPARGRPTVAKAPYKGVIGCGQPAGAACACGHSRLQHGAQKGDRQRPAHGEATRVAPARGKATRVGCPRRGH
ncbi:hypothetical protein BHE74_00056342 [Ensete ventricosum]|nr:hypothetical protein BHE74_00056342 [Ensete ventricosum]